MFRIELPIREPGEAPSHLALTFDDPTDGRAGFAILYLHGFGSYQDGDKASFFRDSMTAAGLPFCSIDFQGHGRSGGSLTAITLSRNLADVGRAHAFLRERGYGRIVLVGSSFGALTGLWYGALNPGEVLAGLHIAPALGMAAGLRARVGEEGLARWEREGVLRLANEQGEADLGWELLVDLEAHSTERLRELYRTPTLLLQGRRDDRVPWREVVAFATGCATGEVELHLFADGDHRLVDRKEHLWSLMRGFLHHRGLSGNPP